MASMFSKSIGPDPSLIDDQKQQMAAERERAAELEARDAASRRAVIGKARGRAQLLGGPETGVKETLG